MFLGTYKEKNMETYEQLKHQEDFQKKIADDILKKQYENIAKSVEFFWNLHKQEIPMSPKF